MTDVLGVVALLLLPVIGISVWRLEAVRRMDFAGRVSIAFAAGALIVSIVLPSMSVVGMSWSRTTVLTALAVAAWSGGLSARRELRRAESPPLHVLVILFFVLLTAYGVLTARETCADLGFFWGPKAIRFVNDSGITAAFLGEPGTIYMHRDYPPLVLMVYAWMNIVAQNFPWWAALLTTAFFLFGTAAFVRSVSGDDAGSMLLAATLAWAFAYGYAAGGGDPALVFFEAIALAALTFIDDPRGRNVLAALGVAGALWTKVEGATFAIAVLIAIVLVQRSVKRAAIVVVPGVLLLATWIFFLARNNLLDGYRIAGGEIHWNFLPRAIVESARSASYGFFGLAWLLPLALTLTGNLRRAALPLAVAVLTAGAAVYIYIHSSDPWWWIAASAPRVFLTPLVALLIAAVASWRDRTI